MTSEPPTSSLKDTVLSNFLLCTAIVLIDTGSAQAQFNVYHPFPDSNAVWGMVTGCMDWNCGSAHYIQDHYDGDTTMDGTSYKKIGQSIGGGSGECSCYPPEDLGPGYIREDTMSRKVFWRMQGSSTDVLLYDFAVNVGDTLQGLMENCDLTWVAGSIDSILIGSGYRKRINYEVSFDPGVQFSIIEGIGSTYGLTTCPYIPFEMGITLLCFTVDGNVLFSPLGPDLTACGDLTSGILHSKIVPGPVVYPNPSTGIFHLGVAAREVQVYNAQGQLLFTHKGHEVDLSTWPPGVYTAVVETGKGRSVERLVVVR